MVIHAFDVVGFIVVELVTDFADNFLQDIFHCDDAGRTAVFVDDEGNPRFVTANDFVYGIKRACDPNIGSYYSSVIAPQIKGCSDVLFAEDPAAIPDEDWDAIGIAGFNAVGDKIQRFQRKVPLFINFCDPNICIVGQRWDELDQETTAVGEIKLADAAH